jgi:hypothetical protein
MARSLSSDAKLPLLLALLTCIPAGDAEAETDMLLAGLITKERNQ